MRRIIPAAACAGVAAATLSASAAFGAAMSQDDSFLVAPGHFAKSARQIRIPDEAHPGGDNARVRVLIVYTPQFLSSLSTDHPPLPEFARRVLAESTRYMQTTGLQTRFELAGVHRWDRARGYRIKDDLDALPRELEERTSLRDAFGADLVQLWDIPDPGADPVGICGWGQAMGSDRLLPSYGYGYSAVLRGLPDTEYASCYAETSPETFALVVAHEFGHNMGAGHDWSDPHTQGAFEFSRAGVCGSRRSGASVGTLMSTSPYRLPHFSSPNLSNDGERCGTAPGEPYSADNRETFTRTASHIAALRDDKASAGWASLHAPDSIAELAGWVPVAIQRSSAQGRATVELLTYGETGIAGIDFTAPLSQILEFAPGQTEITVPIILLPNPLFTGNRSLYLWIQRGDGVAIGASPGKRVVIRDNALPRLSEILPAPPIAPTIADPGLAPGTGASPAGGGGGAIAPSLLILILRRRRR